MTQLPKLVCLVDYRNDRVQWVLNLITDELTQTKYHSFEDTKKGASGWMQVRRLWVSGRREKTSIAFFAKDDEIWLVISNEKFCLSEEATTVSRRTILPFMRCFEVIRQGKILFRVKYLAWNGEGAWPDDGDLFTYVLETLKTEEQKRRFVFIWKANSEGRDILAEGFHDELEAYAKTRTTRN